MNNIIKYIKLLINSNEGKGFKNLAIKLLVFIIPLFFLNYFFVSKIASFENYQIHSALSNIFFFNGISPYSSNIPSVLDNYFSTRNVIIQTSAFYYQLPIYHLFLYLPFSLIPDPKLQISVWLTINELLYAFCILNLAGIFGWCPKFGIKILLIGAGLITYFAFSNILSTNTAIIQLFFLVTGIKELKSGRYVYSGFLLGLSTVDPYNFFLPLVIFFLFLLNKKEFNTIIWTSIAIVLFSLVGIIFDSGWILKMIKNIISNSSFYPFISYGLALKNWVPDMVSGEIVNIIPIIIIIWVILEFSRIPKQSIENLIWIMSLVICLNPIIIMRNSNYASILFTIPIVFIIFLWEKHSSGLINKAIYILLFSITVAIPVIKTFVIEKNWITSRFYTIDLITSLILILLIYWIRWWIVRPYDISLNTE